jgi:D-glycero-D-manno-heptose 1,7-bisphosphate phosphatase
MGVDRRGVVVGVTHWAVFLDRDGVINEPVPHPTSGLPESPHRAEDVALTPGCVEALRLLREGGAALVVVSNQPSAAKGTASDADLDAVHREISARLSAAGVAPDDWRYCRHHPDAVDPARAACDCRKPKPGMLLDAARALDLDLPASWMVGDGDADVGAGRAAGCRTILVEHPGTAHRRGAETPDVTVATILDAARHVMGAPRTPGLTAMEGTR